jgi:hypothetical protein
MNRLFLIAAAMLAVVFAGGTPRAQDADPVILTIDGQISGGTARDFSAKQLEALGMTAVETTTPWHNGKIRFEGVPMHRLLQQVGASGKNAAVVALNNYRTEIPLADFKRYPVILALKKDGAYMPVSEKGPLFIIYPFDASQELKNALYYARSAWQVRKITIE